MYSEGPNLADLQARRIVLALESESYETARQRAWSIAERGGIPESELAVRLAKISSDHARTLRPLSELDREISAAQSAGEFRAEAATILTATKSQWDNGTSDEQREVAQIIATLVGGMVLHPEHKGQILTPKHVTDAGVANYSNCTVNR